MFIPRTPTFTPHTPTVGSRFIVPAYYGIHGVDNRVQPMFYPRTPTVICDCIYIIRYERARWIGPYAYGMYAAIVYVQPMFIPRIYDICPRTPTFTPRAPNCDAWLHLYNSVWTGTMNRSPTPTEYTLRIVYAQPMFIPRTRNIYPRTPTFTPRAPTVMRGCIYTIRWERARWIGPYAYGIHAADCPRTPMFNSRTPIVIRGCIYIIRCGRARWIGPYAYGIHAADCLCATNVYSTNT